MYVQLMRRSGRVQRALKYIWIPCRLEHILPGGGRVEESLLLHMLPKGFLPAPPGEILLTLAHPKGSTGLLNLEIFHPWARHFDCWILELWNTEPPG